MPIAVGSASKACRYSLVSSDPETATKPVPLPRRVDGQAYDVSAVVLHHERILPDGNPGGRREGAGTRTGFVDLDVEDGEVVAGRLFGSRESGAHEKERLISDDREQPAFVGRAFERETRGCGRTPADGHRAGRRNPF